MTNNNKSYKRTDVYKETKVEPKHLFVTLGNIIQETYSKVSTKHNFLDVGGASGDLAAYLKLRFEHQKQYAIEYDEELVKVAQKNYHNIEMLAGDAEALPEQWARKFDVVSMVGVMSIFDDFKPSLSECIRVASTGASIIIIGHFNDFPVDALIHWKYSNSEGDWNKGYNLFSIDSVSTYLNNIPEVSHFEFTPFMVPFDLEPQDDPIRTWTEKNISGEKIFKNGIMPINLKVLTVKIK